MIVNGTHTRINLCNANESYGTNYCADGGCDGRSESADWCNREGEA